MRRRPSILAAFIATVIVFVAVSPLLYGMLVLKVHLPAPPIWIVLLFWFGLPGVVVADAFAGYSRPSSFTLALAVTWIFYFLLVRMIGSWPSFRTWMRRKAMERVARSDGEKP